MKCERCDGLMVRAQHFGFSVFHRKIWIWKCLNCGNVLDRIIQSNRVHGLEKNGRPVTGRGALPRIGQPLKQTGGKQAA